MSSFINSEFCESSFVTFLRASVRGCTTASFAILSPLSLATAGIYGVCSVLGESAISKSALLLGCLKPSLESTCAKVTAYASITLAGVGLGVIATSLMGFPITFTAGLILSTLSHLNFIYFIWSMNDCRQVKAQGFITMKESAWKFIENSPFFY